MSDEKENGLPESFEERIERLEIIVEQLEKGETPLEESLSLFEEGVRLARACQTQIDDARERVEVLLEAAEDGAAASEPLDPDSQETA
ncbi:MAG: exodeoxyribonuclease VII small subunit [bacterium]